MKPLSTYIVIVLLAITVLTHLLKIACLFFKIKLLNKYPLFTSRQLSTSQLFLYYLLTILVCLYGIERSIGG
ncbi:MAG: hypothetical protein EAY72_06780 [Bacteroidetes bacterium]|nr:MAG: hypothetical protein EAY72_06780 [Bacteroidota bacterium]TAE69045.1 MAG: hypothetical protein EAY68_04035 [Bacteroidota bacterium]